MFFFPAMQLESIAIFRGEVIFFERDRDVRTCRSAGPNKETTYDDKINGKALLERITAHHWRWHSDDGRTWHRTPSRCQTAEPMTAPPKKTLTLRDRKEVDTAAMHLLLQHGVLVNHNRILLLLRFGSNSDVSSGKKPPPPACQSPATCLRTSPSHARRARF